MNNLIIRHFVLMTSFLMSLACTAQTSLKLMSYNIRLDQASDGENRWDARKDRVASLMNFYHADFIGGQEVQQHQLQYLLQHLKGYSYIGVGRDDGKEGGEYSCIFYNQDKFKMLQSATFWLSPTPDSISKGWNAAYKRICTYGLFQDKKTKQTFWVFNTHLDHIGQVARLESVKLIWQRIEALNKNGLPVILTGDFNSKPNEPAAGFMAGQMQNARNISTLVHGNADTWNAFKFLEKPAGCIDYIFLSKDKRVSVNSFATITDSYDMKYPSDHFPVFANITIQKK